MDNEQPHQELVKCVVVGDTAVGKTRLICARACNKHISLSQLLTTHVPTVWAIDQYRIYKDVLERSWEVVDGVNVSLRLWDTFGDHDKDRRFAYGRSDVVLLCFSITNPISLRNCATVWYPEIRKNCPGTPILLVGCKNDLRFMYRDETYLSHFKERSPFVRATQKSDLVMPDQARAVALELGLHYYEASVLTYYGVNEVFENAIRAALIARKEQSFWMNNLKRVQRPLLQAPFMPPRPPEPEIEIPPSTFLEDFSAMYKEQIYTDLLIVTGERIHPAHNFVLAATSSAFFCLLTVDFYKKQLNRSSSESSMVSTMGEATQGDFNEDTEKLISNEAKQSRKEWENARRRASYQLVLSSGSETSSGSVKNEFYREINHPAFKSIRIVKCKGQGASPTQTIITMSKLISSEVITQCLNFIYTGCIDNSAFDKVKNVHVPPLSFSLCREISEREVQSWTHGSFLFLIKLTMKWALLQTLSIEIRQAAAILGFYEITKLMNLIHQKQHLVDKETMHKFHTPIRERLRYLFLEGNIFTDITFELDDGEVHANKAILMARCEPMRAMFRGHFRESTASVISFPGISKSTFSCFVCYVYTDELDDNLCGISECSGLLEVANCFCMWRVLRLAEKRATELLSRQTQPERTAVAANLIESAKLHNASGLAAWASWTLCASYGLASKHFKYMQPSTRDCINENRWPPVWYLKEYDYYQKCAKQLEIETKPPSPINIQTEQSGCSCFTGTRRQSKMEDESATASSRLVEESQLDLYEEPVMAF